MADSFAVVELHCKNISKQSCAIRFLLEQQMAQFWCAPAVTWSSQHKNTMASPQVTG